jgi:hypothetical protein
VAGVDSVFMLFTQSMALKRPSGRGPFSCMKISMYKNIMNVNPSPGGVLRS